MRFPGADRSRVRVFFRRAVHKVVNRGAVVRRSGERAVAVADLRREEPEPDAHGRHPVVMFSFQLLVIGVPPFGVAAPGDACEGADARKEHIVEVVGLFRLVRDVGFAEKRPLQPLDVAHLFGAELREAEAVDLFGVEDRRPVVPVLAGRLAHVEIEVLARHHDGAVTLRRGVETGLDALPAVHAALPGEGSRAHGLVPHGGPFAVRTEDCGHALHEEVLQPVRVGHPLPFHQRPAVGTPLPLRHVDLVAAHVDVLRGEQLAQFAQNVAQQRVILLPGHAPCRTVVVTVG